MRRSRLLPLACLLVTSQAALAVRPVDQSVEQALADYSRHIAWQQRWLGTSWDAACLARQPKGLMHAQVLALAPGSAMLYIEGGSMVYVVQSQPDSTYHVSVAAANLYDACGAQGEIGEQVRSIVSHNARRIRYTPTSAPPLRKPVAQARLGTIKSQIEASLNCYFNLQGLQEKNRQTVVLAEYAASDPYYFAYIQESKRLLVMGNLSRDTDSGCEGGLAVGEVPPASPWDASMLKSFNAARPSIIQRILQRRFAVLRF